MFVNDFILFLGLGRFKTVFSAQQEQELVEFIVSMEAQLFGLTLTELRKLAYELAVKNDLDHHFNGERQMAGKQWLYSFLARNPTIRLRTPEATSLARAMGFNKVSVDKFFELLTSLQEKYNFPPEKIWNVDETGITTVPKKQSRVLGLRGKRQVGGLVSAERGTLVTTEICMSAAGNFMPPMFIFPRVRGKPELMDEAPPGSFAEYHPSGWIQKDIFLRWFKKFVEFTNPTKENPVLLLLDGHASHTKNLEVIEYARDHHVVLLCFPPHTTHRLQPLDVSLMGPLSTYYSDEVKTWLRLHPGRPVTIYQVGKLFGVAFQKAASVQNAVSGFRKCGIFPLNPNVFEEWMFSPSKTTDNPIHVTANTSISLDQSTISAESDINEEPVEGMQNSEAIISPKVLTDSQILNKSVDEEPGTSGIRKISTNLNISAKSENQAIGSNFKISPKALMSIPRAIKKPVTRNVRRGKTVILTESPYKKELEESISAKNKNVVKRQIGKALKTNIITKKYDSSSKKKKADARDLVSSSSDEDSQPETACLYCNDLFSNSKSEEGWIQCCSCKNWCHEECAGVDSDDCDQFKCDFCAD